MAAGLQAHGEARIFGTNSAGMALPSMVDLLPNGDALQYVTSDLVDPNGVRVEGQGVRPDQVVALSRASLSEGRDVVLEAAICWIQQERGETTCEL
jgi:carboxyl-terminal processing protease